MIQSIRSSGGRFLLARALAVFGICLAVAPAVTPAVVPVAAKAEDSPPYAVLTPVRSLALPKAADRRLAEALAAHRGKPVLINFWASWCKPCREEIPALQRLSQRLGPGGLVVLTVAVADSDRVANGLLADAATPMPDVLASEPQRPAPLPVVHDRDQVLSRAWGASMLPSTVVLDRRHRIVLRARGAVDWDAPANDKNLLDSTR